jgi:hypothetical protein
VRTVTLDVRDPGEAMKDFVRVWKTRKPEKSAPISWLGRSFYERCSPPSAGSFSRRCAVQDRSIREAARRVGRNIKAVHSDITALLNAGILDRATGGGVVFPYEACQSRVPASCSV